MFAVIFETFYKGPYNITKDKIIVLNYFAEAYQVFKEFKADICYFNVRIGSLLYL